MTYKNRLEMISEEEMEELAMLADFLPKIGMKLRDIVPPYICKYIESSKNKYKE